LLNAARELCEKAECYRFTVTQAAVTISVATHTFASLPTGTVVHRPITLIINEKRLDPTSPTLLDEDDVQWFTRTGQPSKYFMSPDTLSTVRLYPIPEAAYATPLGLNAVLALKPNRTATGLEEIFFENHQRTLIYGALAEVLNVPGRPWYNSEHAAQSRSFFEQAIDDAKDIANADNTPKRREVRYGGL